MLGIHYRFGVKCSRSHHRPSSPPFPLQPQLQRRLQTALKKVSEQSMKGTWPVSVQCPIAGKEQFGGPRESREGSPEGMAVSFDGCIEAFSSQKCCCVFLPQELNWDQQPPLPTPPDGCDFNLSINQRHQIDMKRHAFCSMLINTQLASQL